MDEKYVGSTFDSFLEEEGLQAQSAALAVKRVIAWQIEEAMKQEKLSRTAMARRMNTSRAAINRLLDIQNTSISLQTMEKAAHALGKRLDIQLI